MRKGGWGRGAINAVGARHVHWLFAACCSLRARRVAASGYTGDMCDMSTETLQSKWARFRDKHFAAVATFTPCAGVACFNSTILSDMEPFRRSGVISREIFEQTRTYNMDRTGGKGRMNHYQIISGKLYRSERCPSVSGRMSFHPRCEGIEGTLLQILDEDNLSKMSRRKRKTSGPTVPDTSERKRPKRTQQFRF